MKTLWRLLHKITVGVLGLGVVALLTAGLAALDLRFARGTFASFSANSLFIWLVVPVAMAGFVAISDACDRWFEEQRGAASDDDAGDPSAPDDPSRGTAACREQDRHLYPTNRACDLYVSPHVRARPNRFPIRRGAPKGAWVGQ